jgi:protein O-mannosyl-transferase
MNVSRIKLAGAAVVIFMVTVCLYWPGVRGEFLNGDDREYLRQSEHWNGLTWNAVKWAFTSTDQYYHPLVRLSHVLDYQLFGKSAAGHHATSIVIHALNAALVFEFLWVLLAATSLTMGERLTVAFWVALVFAIHPLQTESVAWIAGRTQLLCTLFGIGRLWAYAAGARRWVVWGLYMLALLCKPMAMSFPFVMLAMDYYPLRRNEQLGWGQLIWEKAGWIAVAAAAGLAAAITKPERFSWASELSWFHGVKLADWQLHGS